MMVVCMFGIDVEWVIFQRVFATYGPIVYSVANTTLARSYFLTRNTRDQQCICLESFLIQKGFMKSQRVNTCSRVTHSTLYALQTVQQLS